MLHIVLQPFLLLSYLLWIISQSSKFCNMIWSPHGQFGWIIYHVWVLMAYRNSQANWHWLVFTRLLLQTLEHSWSSLFAKMHYSWVQSPGWHHHHLPLSISQPTPPSCLRLDLGGKRNICVLDWQAPWAIVNSSCSPTYSAPPHPVFHPACPCGQDASTSSFWACFYDEKHTEACWEKQTSCIVLPGDPYKGMWIWVWQYLK